MEKLNVSYYLSEKLVSKIDERSCLFTGNRSRQVADDLDRFYDLLEAGLHSALDTLTGDDIRLLIGTLKGQPIPSPVGVKSALAVLIPTPDQTRPTPDRQIRARRAHSQSCNSLQD